MAKYIVEVKDGETLYKAVIAPDGEPYITPAMGSLYTEPDMEQVRKKAYDKGFDVGRTLNTGKYEKGLDDAWEAARKICLNECDGGMTPTEVNKILGVGFYRDALLKYSAIEAIEKIRQYEQGKEEQIQVGDEVVSEDDIKAVVIDMDDYLLHVLDENGVVQGWPREDVAKTERHFPEIAEVLEKMREDAT